MVRVDFEAAVGCCASEDRCHKTEDREQRSAVRCQRVEFQGSEKKGRA